MRMFIVLCVLVGLSQAAPRYGQFVYAGQHRGVCGKDGFYFHDAFSFVVCANGQHYVQPCSPGTRNGPRGKYTQAGKHFKQADFCNINLNDYGYAANVNAGLHGYYPARPLPPPFYRP